MRLKLLGRWLISRSTGDPYYPPGSPASRGQSTPALCAGLAESSTWSQLRYDDETAGASGWSVSRILSGETNQFTRDTPPFGLVPCFVLAGRFSDHLSVQSTRGLSFPKEGLERAAPLSLFDLALDGGCLAAHIAAGAGGLLHHLFTMTGMNPGCPFLWPDPTDHSVPGFPRRRALQSTDFPRPCRSVAAIAQPA